MFRTYGVWLSLSFEGGVCLLSKELKALNVGLDMLKSVVIII